jgi:hypothetical protein
MKNMTRQAKPQSIKISMMSKTTYCTTTHDMDEEGQLDEFTSFVEEKFCVKENFLCVRKNFLLILGVVHK